MKAIIDQNVAYALMFWMSELRDLGFATTGVYDVAAGAAEGSGYFGYYPDGRLKHHDWDTPVTLHYADPFTIR